MIVVIFLFLLNQHCSQEINLSSLSFDAFHYHNNELKKTKIYIEEQEQKHEYLGPELDKLEAKKLQISKSEFYEGYFHSSASKSSEIASVYARQYLGSLKIFEGMKDEILEMDEATKTLTTLVEQSNQAEATNKEKTIKSHEIFMNELNKLAELTLKYTRMDQKLVESGGKYRNILESITLKDAILSYLKSVSSSDNQIALIQKKKDEEESQKQAISKKYQEISAQIFEDSPEITGEPQKIFAEQVEIVHNLQKMSTHLFETVLIDHDIEKELNSIATTMAEMTSFLALTKYITNDLNKQLKEAFEKEDLTEDELMEKWKTYYYSELFKKIKLETECPIEAINTVESNFTAVLRKYKGFEGKHKEAAQKMFGILKSFMTKICFSFDYLVHIDVNFAVATLSLKLGNFFGANKEEKQANLAFYWAKLIENSKELKKYWKAKELNIKREKWILACQDAKTGALTWESWGTVFVFCLSLIAILLSAKKNRTKYQVQRLANPPRKESLF